MRYRPLGTTGLRVSEIGFGCGPTAGLMINATSEQRRAAVARALALGVNYFDTAPIYGDTVSEAHLGQALRELGCSPIVATKVALLPDELGDIPAAIRRSLDLSQERLGVDCVDVLHLHNRVAANRAAQPDIGVGTLLSVDDVLGRNGVLETFLRLKEQGRTRAIGCCAFGGEVPVVHAVIDHGGFDAVLVPYSALNPTAAVLPAGFRGRDFGQVIERAAARGMGVVALRVLEAGALTGREDRHPLSRAAVDGTALHWQNLARARALDPFAEEIGCTPAQLAIRFALANPAISTVLVGFSEMAHLEEAAACADGRTLPSAVLSRIDALYQTDFGLAQTA
jgi:L-galactose dehydrogenase/L-glyceraldehyde 3-phosphate reductase